MAKVFSRKLQGHNVTVFVAKPIDYTTDATLSLFTQLAPVGELGVYDANNALHTDAITAAEQFCFYMRTTAGVRKTPLFKLSEIVSVVKKLYEAPVKQVSTIGWGGTGGNIYAPTIAAKQVYAIKIIETTEGNDPAPTWNYDVIAGPADAQIDIFRKLAAKINDSNAVEHKQNERLVSAKVKADATYGNYTLGGTTPTLTVVNGSNAVALGGTTPTSDIAVGDYMSFDGAATPSDSVGDIYKVITITGSGATQVYTLDRPYQGANQTFTQAEAQGTRVKKVTAFVTGAVGLELTALDFGVHFKTAAYENLADADQALVTAYKNGNGTYDQVRALEDEGNEFDGTTTRNVEFPDDFGKQDIFSVPGETYDYYQFTFLRSTAGIAPEAMHQERYRLGIAVAKSAGNVDTTLDTLFALTGV